MSCLAMLAVSALVLYAAFLKSAADGATAFEEPDIDAMVGRAEAEAARASRPGSPAHDAGFDRDPSRREAA